jgi:colanic acid/amylovoran biosynthesis glycosyltransferase
VSDLVQSAGLAQRALVLSPTPGLENAVADEKEVAFVEARNAQALADKLAYLIEHPERRRSMGKALEMRVRADYQIEEMHHRTRTLYGVE